MRNLTRRRTAPRSAFAAIASHVLPGWDISLIFVGPVQAQKLNEQLRGKKHIPNVLSYIVGEKSGEIIICPSEAAKQAPTYNLQPTTYNLLLFIHGALHIKGWAHGVRMEKCERNLLEAYGTAHSYRYRHRHVPSKNGRRRGGRG